MFGVLVALSLSGETGELGAAADALRSVAEEAGAGGAGESPVDGDWQSELGRLEVLSALMAAVVDFERDVEAAGRVRARDRKAFREACTAGGDGPEIRKWLDVYLRRRWPANA